MTRGAKGGRYGHPRRRRWSGLRLAQDAVHGRAADRALALGHVHAGLRDFHGALEVALLLALHAVAVVRVVGHGSSSSCCRPGRPGALLAAVRPRLRLALDRSATPW